MAATKQAKTRLKTTPKLRQCKAWGCKIKFEPHHHKQIYCTPECRDREGHRKMRAARKAAKAAA